jgi:ABC-2 type transport system ATP-binding protein
VDEDERRITVPSQGGVQELMQVGRILSDAGLPIDDFGLRRPTLDDVFLALTGHGAGAEETGTAASGVAAEARR